MPKPSACQLCRDRKVKCDGNHPTCDRCLRSFETCVYDTLYKPTKADLVRTIEVLRDRVGIVSPKDTAEAIARQSPPIQLNIPSPIVFPAPESSSGIDYPSSSPLLDNHFTSFMNSHDPYIPLNNNEPFHSQSVVPFRDNLESDFINYLSNAHIPDHNDAAFTLENFISAKPPSGHTVQSFNGVNEEYRPVTTPMIPSLREVRALNSPGSASPKRSPDNAGVEKEDDKVRIVSELKKYACATFEIHADVAGISSAVAEYLSWIRKTPSRMLEEISKTDSTSVLGVLERRVLELHEIAETRHQAAWRQMVEVLQDVNGMEAELRGLESEVEKRKIDAKLFFENYDICRSLYEQR